MATATKSVRDRVLDSFFLFVTTVAAGVVLGWVAEEAGIWGFSSPRSWENLHADSRYTAESDGFVAVTFRNVGDESTAIQAQLVSPWVAEMEPGDIEKRIIARSTSLREYTDFTAQTLVWPIAKGTTWGVHFAHTKAGGKAVLDSSTRIVWMPLE